jgi:hypothetical protein
MGSYYTILRDDDPRRSMYHLRMGGLLAGWSRQLTVDGLYLLPPDSSRNTWISIRQRVAPLRPFEQAVRAALAQLPADRALGPVEHAWSHAGNPVASMSVTGDAFASRLAAIYTEYFYTWIHGIGRGAHAAKVPAIVDALALDLYVGLPARRRRWFRYAPPPGWHGFRRHDHTLWVPRDQALRPASMHVFDAVPHGMPARFETSDGHVIAPELAPVNYGVDIRRDANGDVGTLHVWLRDDSFTYLTRFAGAAELDRVAVDLVASIEPMPPAATANVNVAHDQLWPE